MASKNKSRNKNVRKQRRKDSSPPATTPALVPPPEFFALAPQLAAPLEPLQPPETKGVEPEVEDEPELQPLPRTALALFGLALPVTLWASLSETEALIGSGEIGWALAAVSLLVALLPGLLLASRLGARGHARVITMLVFLQFLFPFLPRYFSAFCHARGGGFLELLVILLMGMIGPVSVLAFGLFRLLSDPQWFHPLRRRLQDLALAAMAGVLLCTLLAGQREITVLGVSFLLVSAGVFWIQPAFMRLLGGSLGVVLVLMAGPTFMRHSAQLIASQVHGVENASLRRSRLGSSGLVQEFASPRPVSSQEEKADDPAIQLLVAGVATRASQRPVLAALLFDLPHTLGAGNDILVLGGSVLLVTQPGDHFAGGWIVAEPDPTIADLIRTDPVWAKHIETGKVRVITDPWIPFLREKPQYFDLVLLDPLPAMSWESALPYTVGFLADVKKVLKPAGILAVGLATVSPSEDLGGIWSPLAAGLLENFPQVLAASSTLEAVSLYLASDGLPFNAEELPYKLQMIVPSGDWTMVESSVLQTVIRGTPPLRHTDTSATLVESWRSFYKRFQLGKES